MTTIDEKRLTEIERLSGDFPHVAQLTAEIRRLWLERDVWRKAAQTMTPQGSEFTTAQACLDHNRRWRTEQQESTIRAHGKANAAEARAARLGTALRGLLPYAKAVIYSTDDAHDRDALRAATDALAAEEQT